MSRSEDLFQLLLELPQKGEISEVLALFLENLNKFLAPCSFIHAISRPDENISCFPIDSNDFNFGFIIPTAEKSFLDRDNTLLLNSVQMLAIVLENITLKEKLRINQPGAGIDYQKSESTIQEKDFELEKFFLSAIDLFCIADTDGYFQQLNKEWERVLGYRLEDLEGKRFLDLVHPDDLSATLGAIKQLESQKEILNFTNRYLCKDGSYRWIEWRSTPKGKLIYAAARDITDRMQIEEDLQLEKEFRQRVFDGSRVAIVVMDADTSRYIDCNPAAIDIYRCDSRSEVIGKKPIDFSAPTQYDGTPSIQKARFYHEEALKKGKIIFEWRHQRQNGEIWDAEVHLMSFRTKEHQLLQFTLQDITERKRAENALRESEEKYRHFIENSQDIIYSFSADSIIRFVSPAWTRILGHKVEEVENHSLSEFLHPDDLPAITAIFRKVVKTGKQKIGIEYRIKHADGTWRWHISDACPIRDTSGKVIRYEGIAHDFTDRKNAEIELLAAKQFTEKLLESLPGISFLYDQNCHLKRWNKAHETDLGYSPDELQDWFIPDWHESPEEAEAGLAWAKQVIENGASGTIETTLKNKKGEYIPYLISTTRLMTPEGPFMVGVGIDNSEHKRAEKELLHEKQFTEKLLESLPGIFFLYDQNLHLKRWNKAHETEMGYSADELRDWHIYDWHETPEEAEQGVASARFVLETGESEAVETTLKDKQGNFVPYLISTTRLETPEGPYIMGVGIDITERKQAQKEKEKLQEQLVQSQKIESIGRLAGGVAHDFNNMLQAILGNTEIMLVNPELENYVRESLLEIQKYAIHSTDLTRQLLAFARKQTIAPKVLDLNKTVTGMLKMLSRLIGEYIDLEWFPGENLSLVNMDPSQIDQILANLCINARDAIGNRTGKLTIETANVCFDEEYCAKHADYVPGNYVLLAVSDDGSGMDEETLANVFEPFFTTKEMGKGTGLGLATVYGVVKQNKGFISVYSEPDQGTSFKIFLPCCTNGVVQQSKEIKIAATSGGETILLVEDEPAILTMVAAMLESLKYKVISARTPDEAINLTKEYSGKIDLLMTDVVMPEMNGRELSNNLIAMNPNLKCLFMSGYTSNVIAHHGVLDKDVHFIQKPFTLQTLTAKVQNVLANEK